MITLYSIGCPKCNVLKAKLKAANISYNEISATAEILSRGIEAVPVLEVDGRLLDYSAAVKWIDHMSEEQHEKQ